jgi:hypothetical protein
MEQGLVRIDSALPVLPNILLGRVRPLAEGFFGWATRV